MKLIVKTFTKLTMGVIFLFGCYIALYGHIGLGGGLAGGVIIALSNILYALAFGIEHSEVKKYEQVSLLAASFAAALFLILTLFSGMSVPVGKPGELLSGGLIPIFNLALMAVVGSSLFCFFIFLAEFKFRLLGRKE